MIVKKRLLTFAVFLVVIMTISLSEKPCAQPIENQVHLPKTIGKYALSDSVGKINSQNIFEYMDGAGELYLGYQFDHLDVYEYTAEAQNSILVELYFMKNSDDAFGLLSLDWGGESINLADPPTAETTSSIAPASRALYGAGLLRLWSENIYARVMAYQVTPESEKAVFAIGRAIAAYRSNPPQPRLLKILSDSVASELTLLKDRIRYFRSYLVLNSFYYLSHQNILNLDIATEAVAALYEKVTPAGDRKRVQFLFVKYANPEQARKALDHFHETYLPEQRKKLIHDNSPHFYKIENGWVGYYKTGRYLALVFDCPDQETGQIIFNQIEVNLKNLEDDHGE
ncbi:MAG TPA: DUF6599 family protein [bacterium]